ncbi:MAG: T9SS type A sorting domain-containing protein [Bacteroidia bacterium]|nr:T9SS type A sorting domain-containing protein [Bacteroidia bacterium]
MNAADTVQFYLNFNHPFKISNTKLVYPTAVRLKFDTLGTLLTSDTLRKDTTYYLTKDTIRIINLGGAYGIWTDHNVYLNDNYPVNPTTITVATFDGLDSVGMPYDFSKPNTYGVADYLTSKPIDLKSNITSTDTTVYFSFFYQPQGIGNAPEEDDSLAVEIYSPSVGYWRHLWSVKGSELPASNDFKQVMIPIRDSLLLTKGVQFRFKNYATLSGDFDHWHIDYIKLDKNRSATDTVIFDIAVTNIERSFLNGFYVMPYKYFKNSPDAYLKNTVSCSIRNLSNLSPTSSSLALNIYHQGALAYSKNYGVVPFTPGLTKTIAQPRDNYKFVSATSEDWSDFKVMYNFSSTISPTVDLRSNDTVSFNQAFRDYFQRDDGSTEAAYYIDGQGSVAVKFQVPRADTLRALDMLFLPLTPGGLNALFKIRVWEDSAGFPGKVLYESSHHLNPSVTNRNYPALFMLDKTVIVNNYFHVGWYQEGNEQLNIGFDKNTDNSLFASYNVDGSWYASTKAGTPLIRPWLGANTAVGLTSTSSNKNYKVFPNPSKKVIYLNIYKNFDYQIFNPLGQIVSQGFDASGSSSISVEALPSGLYYITVSGKDFHETLPFVKE